MINDDDDLGGFLFLSTISRTPLSYLLTIILAQNILKLVPNETHDFNKYIRHDELTNMIENVSPNNNNDNNIYPNSHNRNNMWGKVVDVTGIGLNPITGKWFELVKSLPLNLHVNYFITAKRTK